MNRRKIARLAAVAMIAVAVVLLSAPPAQAGIGFRLKIGSLLRSSGGRGGRAYLRHHDHRSYRAPVYRSHRGYSRTCGYRTGRYVTLSSPHVRRYATIHQRPRVYRLGNVVVVVYR